MIKSCGGWKAVFRVTTSKPSLVTLAILSNCLTSLRFFCFFKGRIPCCKCLRASCIVGQLSWIWSHAFGDAKGTLISPLIMSETDIELTVRVSLSSINLHTEQFELLHVTLFLLPKSESWLLIPFM